MNGFPPKVRRRPDRPARPARPGPRGMSVANAHYEVGRVAFASDGDMTILPVTYLLDGAGVSFLTTWGSKLQV